MLTRNQQQHLVIDADSHVVEPMSVWTDYVPPGYRERAPTLVDDAGTDWLVCEGIRLMSSAHMSGLTRGDATLASAVATAVGSVQGLACEQVGLSVPFAAA